MGLFNLLFKRPQLKESKVPVNNQAGRYTAAFDESEPESKVAKDHLVAVAAIERDEKKYGSPEAVVRLQDQEYKRLSKAQAAYEKDGDINKLISVYESALIDGKVFLYSQSLALELVSLYKKAGLNDKAWSYTNYMLMKGFPAEWKVYQEQAKLLKSEKKYLEAVRAYMHMYHFKDSYGFNREKFLKDINVCAKKLGWDEEKKNRVADVVAYSIEKNLDAVKMNELAKKELM